MSGSQYFLVSGIIFTIVAIAHLARIVYQIPVLIDSYTLPMWPSYLALIVPVFLAVTAFTLWQRTERS